MSFCFLFFQGFAGPRGEKGPRGSTGGQVKFLVPSCETVFFFFLCVGEILSLRRF